MSSMNFTYDVCGREVLSCTFVNGMKFTCDVCGREVFTCTFVNGMKFCAKCYQETFGETDKDRKIADLEAKLAEKEKENLTLFSMLYETLEKQGCENIVSTIEQMTNLTLEKQSNWFKGNCVKDQDKISFAIEQLEKVEEILWNSQDIGNVIDNDKFLEKLNYLIKSLKGEVYE